MKWFTLLALAAGQFAAAEALCQSTGVLSNIQIGGGVSLALSSPKQDPPAFHAAASASIAYLSEKSDWGGELAFEYGHRRSVSGVRKNELGNTMQVVRRVRSGRQRSSGTYLGLGYSFSQIDVGLRTGGAKLHGAVASIGQRIMVSSFAVLRPELAVLRDWSRRDRHSDSSGVTRFTVRIGFALTSPVLW